MRLPEVWSECRIRLGIEEKSELFDALKTIDNAYSCALGLNENPSTVNLTRLRNVLRLLRKLNVMHGNVNVENSQNPS